MKVKENKNLLNKSNYEILKYSNPLKIYIPLFDKYENNRTILVKENDYVFKGDPVLIDDKTKVLVHSPVSGYVSEYFDKMISSGKMVKCLVIDSDLKEKTRKESMRTVDIDNYTKDELLDDLKNSGIVGLGGSIYPTYLKYREDIKYLIVNAVECEPFVTADKSVLYNYAPKILETVDNLIKIMHLEKAYIALKETDKENIKVLNKYINKYPNISLSLIKDAYPNGWEKIVVSKTLGVTYEKYPSEKNICVSNVSTIYAISLMLLYNTPLIERTITLTGPGIKKKCNVNVKVGTLASDLIKELDGYNKIKNPLFIIGGLMMGKSIPTDDVVITKDVSSIIVIDDFFEKNLNCINCGKCIETCPVGLKPALIMKNIDNPKILKKLNVQKCIECGLCSFNCPSKIEVRDYIRIAKEKVKDLD